VFVAASAGNSGPDASTVAHPSPWFTTVAAGTHNRTLVGTVTLGNGTRLSGASATTKALAASPMINASDAGLPEGMPGIEVQLDISTRSFERLKDRRRSLAGRTGCGVCGVESFAGLDLTPQRVPPRAWIERIDLATVLRAFAAMPPRQVLNAEAGAIHAAAWATADGELTDLMEDVGRHNALDKLLGKLALAGRLEEPGFVLMSSRGSHELVRKCARLGIAAMATISAPTSMGVRMAELSGLRFWGLCRAPRGVLYADGLAVQPSASTASATASIP
jgi:FdhD protein